MNNGKYKGEDVLVPRIPMISTNLPFDFKWLLFPMRLAFTMTINKSQGQVLEIWGIILEFPCFVHGQIYVASSRVWKLSSLYIYAPQNKTKKKKIVYQKALYWLSVCIKSSKSKALPRTRSSLWKGFKD